MSLFVRVFTNFYSHRKTARLRVRLGSDALWIPPRLWSYAADNQPDGNFEGYTAEEIAMLIGYTGDAKAMLEALLETGFMDSDPLSIHDWQAHNGYHQAYSARAKKAAKARWKGKERIGEEIEKKGKDRIRAKHTTSNACSIYEAYPRKVGKPSAIRAILKALKVTSYETLLEKTKMYAASRNGEDAKFTPHPATWFHQERFNDDPTTWANGNGAHAPAPPVDFSGKPDDFAFQ